MSELKIAEYVWLDSQDKFRSKSRTIEDKQNNLGKIFIAKNRNGPDGMIYPIFMDTSNVNIKILPKVANHNNASSNPAVVTSPVSLGPVAQKQYLQAKYTKLSPPN